METLPKLLIGLAGLCFLAAVVFALGGLSAYGATAEGLSRATSNLALIAIALLLLNKPGAKLG